MTWVEDNTFHPLCTNHIPMDLIWQQCSLSMISTHVCQDHEDSVEENAEGVGGRFSPSFSFVNKIHRTSLFCRYTRMLRMMTLRWCTHLPVNTYATNDDISAMHSFAGIHVCYEWWHCGDALICRYTRMLRMMTLRWCTHLPVNTYATNDDIAVMHSFAGIHVCYEWWHCGDALICR